jgi:hypothetical protein
LSLTARIQTPIYSGLFNDLGCELPGITKLLSKTYRYFGIAPIIGIILTVDLIRRKTIRLPHAALVLIFLFVVGFALKIVLSEGVTAPMLKMMEGIRSFHD